MIADPQAGRFDAILVLKIDRFARSLRDSTIYRELLRDCGIRLLSRTEPYGADDTPAGVLMNSQADLYAAHYSIQLSDNATRGKPTRAAKGLPNDDLPFGYRSAGQQEPPIVLPEEADQVRRCFREYVAGNRSMAELADRLNAAGFGPRSKRGRAVFSKATLSGMLSNPTYVGDVTRHGKVVAAGRHEPIVDRAPWDAVHEFAASERASRKSMAHVRNAHTSSLASDAALPATRLFGEHHQWRRAQLLPVRFTSARRRMPPTDVWATARRSRGSSDQRPLRQDDASSGLARSDR